ncbi:hypothetical protein LCGC14_0195510 [marine sediment metagenome]|uniref:Uncharacterized protein n=1 Tax=marine sediment metagenome TaxID=412755 RepID=A0A0F9XND5_9ZZZZ
MKITLTENEMKDLTTTGRLLKMLRLRFPDAEFKIEGEHMDKSTIELIQKKSRVLTKALHLEETNPEIAAIEFLKSATLEYEIFQKIGDFTNLESAFWSMLKIVQLETKLDVSELMKVQ